MTKQMMSLIALLLLLLALSGCFALQEAPESSGQVVAPTLALATAEPTAAPPTEVPPTDVPPTEMPTEVPTEEPATAEPTAEPTEAPTEVPTEVPTAEPTAEPTSEPAAAGNLVIYQIDPARSEARFIINEVLSGEPTRVVGTTTNVGGQLAVDLAAPAATQIGAIVINARDLRTDNSFRNNAIANRILLTDQYELITFTPTQIVGLPASVTIGESYSFQIVGNLEMVGETREVTFDATVTAVSAGELGGSVTTTVAYGDWGIEVPLSQMVSAVADTVTLELDFVAVQQ